MGTKVKIPVNQVAAGENIFGSRLYKVNGSVDPYLTPLSTLEANWTANHDGLIQWKETAREMSRAVRVDPDGPWAALVLKVAFVYYYGDEERFYAPVQAGGLRPTRRNSKSAKYIKIWAQRPSVDQWRIQPDWSYLGGEYATPTRQFKAQSAEERNALINMYPTYIVSQEEWGSQRTPHVGDIMAVTFEHKISKTGGKILGFVDQSDLQLVPTSFPAGTSPDIASAHESFVDPKRSISDVFEDDEGPMIREPTAEQLKAAVNVMAFMAPGPEVRNQEYIPDYLDGKTPNTLRFKTGTPRRTFDSDPPQEEYIQTLIWENGRPVYTKDAPYLIALCQAALKDGIRLYSSSLYRTAWDNVTGNMLKPHLVNKFAPEGAVDQPYGGYVGWDGKPLSKRFLAKVWARPEGSFAASQKKLRIAHCTPIKEGDDVLTSPSICKPKTGPPTDRPAYAFSHGAGWANDIGMNMDRHAGTKPQDPISKAYRWMCLNAYKFGFIRTVDTERWHWECRLDQTPRPRMFSAISRRNGSWDNQFNQRGMDYYDDPNDQSFDEYWDQDEENERKVRQTEMGVVEYG
jgi:hypothetical protein